MVISDFQRLFIPQQATPKFLFMAEIHLKNTTAFHFYITIFPRRIVVIYIMPAT